MNVDKNFILAALEYYLNIEYFRSKVKVIDVDQQVDNYQTTNKFGITYNEQTDET